MKSFSLSAVIFSTILLIAACGGGADGGSSSTSTSSSGNPNTLGNSDGGTNIAPAIWTGVKQLGVVSGSTTGTSTATDANGNVYIAGFTDGGFNGSQKIGAQDGFLAKYSSSGSRQYVIQFGAIGATVTGHSVATDATGNVFVTGDTNRGLDGNTMTGNTDMFVSKFDSSGTKLFTKQIGASGVDTFGRSVAVDSAGNVYISGITKGGLDSNSITGSQDAFIVKYSSSGTKLWARQFGAAFQQTNNYGVTVDSTGNIYAAGHTRGGLDGHSLIGAQDFYIAKYDSSGAKLWIQQFGATGAIVTGRAVATDVSGGIYIAGSTSLGLDGNTLTGTQDFYLAKLDSSGVKQYIKQLGAVSAATIGQGVEVDASGGIYVVGYTNGNLDGLTLTGLQDTFITKFDNVGAKQFTKLLGVAGAISVARGVVKDLTGNLFLAGYTSGGLDGNVLTGVQDYLLAKYSSSGARQ